MDKVNNNETYKDDRKLIGLLLILLFGLVGFGLINNANISAFIVNEFPTDDRGNVEVAIQDQFTEIIDLRLSQLIAEINITENTSVNDRYVNISSSVAPQVFDLVCFKEGTAFYQSEILSVTSLGGTNYQIEMQQPLDFAFTTAGGCSIRNDNWALAATPENPEVFTVSPSGLYDNVSWDITRVILVCLGDGTSSPDPTPDLSAFMTMDSLSNGIVFRQVDGTTKNIFAARDNFHLVSETYDLTIYPTTRFGKYAVTSRRTFNGPDKNGVTVRLDAETNDRFDLLIQDDLTDMDECHAVIQGHVVD